MGNIIRSNETVWDYAVRDVRDVLNSEGLQAASDKAQIWCRNVAFDPVKLLADAKGVPIHTSAESAPK